MEIRYLVYVVLFGAVSVSAVEYNLTWAPDRPEINNTRHVDIHISLDNFTQPLGPVELRHANYYPLLRSDDDKCQVFNLTVFRQHPYKDIKLLECSPRKGRFAVRVVDIHNFLTLTVNANSQNPRVSRPSTVGFQRPRGITLYAYPTPYKANYWRAGEWFQASCNFIGGVMNKANFSWYVTSANSPNPRSRIENGQDWHSLSVTDDGVKSTLTGILGPGDDGNYTCVANYIPRYVGAYISQPKYIDMKYSPQQHPRRTYPTEYSVKSGKSVNIKWTVLANPPPKRVYWRKNGRSIRAGRKYRISEERDSKNNSTVTFSIEFKARRGTYGVYSCMIVNAVGNKNAVFHVRPAREYDYADDDTTATVEGASNAWNTTAISLTGVVLFVLIVLIGLVAFALYWRRRKDVTYKRDGDVTYHNVTPPPYSGTPEDTSVNVKESI